MIPFQTNAATLGGWSIGGSTVQGASVVLNGTKDLILNGAKKIANGTAKITPPPASVAKALAGGAAAIALDLAVKELLGGVDYVLDPANNQINYSVHKQSTNINSPTVQFYYSLGNGIDFSTNYQSLGEKICNNYEGVSFYTNDPNSDGKRVYCNNGNFYSIFRVANPNYDPTAQNENEIKHLPLNTVAQKVIDQAASGSPEAQQAIKAAADTIVAEAETDSTKARPIINQFEKTSTIETTEKSTSESESTTTTNTANSEESTTKTDTSTEFPVFCGWAPTICEAANVVIQKPQEWAESIKAAYDDAVDYFKSEPEQTDNTLDIGEENQTQPDTTISFQTSCPAKIPLTFNWNGQTLDFSFDFTIWCESISTFVYPIVVALGSLHALYIVAGVRQDG